MKVEFFFDRLSANTQISLKSIQWKPSSSMQVDGQTDLKKLIFAFHNFANMPKNSFCLKITPDTVLIYELGKTWVIFSLNCHLTSTNLDHLMNFMIVILAYIFSLIIWSHVSFDGTCYIQEISCNIVSNFLHNYAP